MKPTFYHKLMIRKVLGLAVLLWHSALLTSLNVSGVGGEGQLSVKPWRTNWQPGGGLGERPRAQGGAGVWGCPGHMLCQEPQAPSLEP